MREGARPLAAGPKAAPPRALSWPKNARREERDHGGGVDIPKVISAFYDTGDVARIIPAASLASCPGWGATGEDRTPVTSTRPCGGTKGRP